MVSPALLLALAQIRKDKNGAQPINITINIDGKQAEVIKEKVVSKSKEKPKPKESSTN